MTTARTKTRKPEKKPYADFPLTPHPSGRWCKKIRGKLHYFGSFDGGWQAALARYKEQADDLHAGLTPRTKADGLQLRDLFNAFLTAKQRKVDAGEMQPRSWAEYKTTCGHIGKVLGLARLATDLRSDDFGRLRAYFAKGRGVDALTNQIRRTRSIFKHAFDAELTDQPVRFGAEFRPPDKTMRRKAKQAKAPRLFSSEEIRKLLDAASVQMKAMILLGVNCGLGNSDCAALPKSALDLERGILFYPRPKTAIERRATLWPETVTAIKAAIAVRPDAKDPADDDCVFLTRLGQKWVRLQESNCDAVTCLFKKLMVEVGIDKIGEKGRTGVSFYSLRHTLETIGGETGDQAAVDRIMGHSRNDMATHYREWSRDEREDERLRRVTDHVRAWLFEPAKKSKPAPLKIAAAEVA